MLTEKNQFHFLGLEGETNQGKSRLLRELLSISINQFNAFTSFVDIRDNSQNISQDSIMDIVKNQIDPTLFQNYSHLQDQKDNPQIQLRNITQRNSSILLNAENSWENYKERVISSFASDLHKLHKKKKYTVLFFDTFNEANIVIQKWLYSELFQRICNFGNIWVVFSGLTLPPPATSWLSKTHFETITCVYDLEPYKTVCSSLGLMLTDNEISLLCTAFGGKPGSFAQSIPNLEKRGQ
jgi:hypothetical protein